MNDIRECVVRALAQTLEIDSPETISTEANLREVYGLDSMSSLTFLMQLENLIDGFEIDARTLTFTDLENIETVAAYVEKHYVSN